MCWPPVALRNVNLFCCGWSLCARKDALLSRFPAARREDSPNFDPNQVGDVDDLGYHFEVSPVGVGLRCCCVPHLRALPCGAVRILCIFMTPGGNPNTDEAAPWPCQMQGWARTKIALANTSGPAARRARYCAILVFSLRQFCFVPHTSLPHFRHDLHHVFDVHLSSFERLPGGIWPPLCAA